MIRLSTCDCTSTKNNRENDQSVSIIRIIAVQKILDQFFTELPQSILQRFVQRHEIDHFLSLRVVIIIMKVKYLKSCTLPAQDALGLESVHRGAEKETRQCALGRGPKDVVLEPPENIHHPGGCLTCGQDFSKNLRRRGTRMKGVDVNVAAV